MSRIRRLEDKYNAAVEILHQFDGAFDKTDDAGYTSYELKPQYAESTSKKTYEDIRDFFNRNESYDEDATEDYDFTPDQVDEEVTINPCEDPESPLSLCAHHGWNVTTRVLSRTWSKSVDALKNLKKWVRGRNDDEEMKDLRKNESEARTKYYELEAQQVRYLEDHSATC